MTELLDAIRSALGPEAVLGSDELGARSAGVWGGGEHLAALGLVRPADTAEIAQVLALCHARGQTVVTHGGLTGLVDGAATRPSDLILSTERMTQIEDVDVIGQTMTVQAGVPLERVQTAAREHGLDFPLDLGARGTATIGGNAATNAGGNRVIRYGMSRALILGLEAVLADGTVVSSMNQMLKNNAGYDVKQLFIGSEGTLGVITRLVLRLIPAARSCSTALVAVRDFDSVTGLLRSMDAALAGALSAFEVMWQDYYAFITARQDAAPPLAAEHAYFVLIEAQGADAARDEPAFEEALGEAMADAGVEDAVIAKSEHEREKLWGIRDDVVQILELEPMFIYDVSLPIRAIDSYVRELRAALTEKWSDGTLMVFGHLGDGNIHLAISAGPAGGAAHADVNRQVYPPLQALGGSVSAEHGIGLEKKPYLDWCRTDAEVALMRRLKAALDPQGLLNPGKIFD